MLIISAVEKVAITEGEPGPPVGRVDGAVVDVTDRPTCEVVEVVALLVHVKMRLAVGDAVNIQNLGKPFAARHEFGKTHRHPTRAFTSTRTGTGDADVGGDGARCVLGGPPQPAFLAAAYADISRRRTIATRSKRPSRLKRRTM